MNNVTQEKLLNMLNNEKISKHEFEQLSVALNKKSLCEYVEESFLVNPFRKIGGWHAFALGALILVITSFIASNNNMYIDGLMGLMFNVHIKTKIPPNFMVVLLQSSIASLMLASFYYLAATFFRQRKIRFIDFIGTVLLARLPVMVLAVLYVIRVKLNPMLLHVDFSHAIDITPKPLGMLFAALYFTCFIWQAMTYFFAYQESSGLSGRKLWISYMFITYPLAHIITFAVTRALVI